MTMDAREELAELVRLLGAHVEWQRELGLQAVPRVRKTAPSANTTVADSKPDFAVNSTTPSNVAPDFDTPAPAAPAETSAAPECPRFELPAFLRKNGPPPSRPVESALQSKPSVTTQTTAPPTTVPPENIPEKLPPPTSAPKATVPVGSTPSLFGNSGFGKLPLLKSLPVLPEPERRQALDELCNRVEGCTACRLSSGRTNTVFARGNPMATLVFVGEGPGRDEDLQGLPFVGAAGQLLDRIISAMGFSPDEVWICNVVKCRPPNNRTPEPDEIVACGAYLEKQLQLVQPQAMVALGRTAANFLLGKSEPMSRMRGRWNEWCGVPFLSTWHPAYLLRQPEAKRETWDDMKLVLERLGRPVPKRSGA